LGDDDDLNIDDKSPQYTRREYEDSEAIDNNNDVDNCKSRKNSKISIVFKKKYSIFIYCIEANGIKKIIRNYS